MIVPQPRPSFPIDKPGAYLGISAEEYHRTEICIAPSISASGLKTIENRSLRHYWTTSALNPYRPADDQKRHLNVGKAIHDALLLGEEMPSRYHVLPFGFNAAATRAQADAITARDEAAKAGKVILSCEDAVTVGQMAAAIREHDLASKLLMAGDPEVTLVWQDELTGVWCRCRPDYLPWQRIVIPELKSAANASEREFQRAIDNFGYHMAAAHYLDGLDAIFGPGPEKRHFVFVTIEKEPPFAVTLYQLDDEDIQRGRMLNRRALNRFAECLSNGTGREHWPSYDDGKVKPIQLPPWTKSRIDAAAERGELSYYA